MEPFCYGLRSAPLPPYPIATTRLTFEAKALNHLVFFLLVNVCLMCVRKIRHVCAVILMEYEGKNYVYASLLVWFFFLKNR